MGRTAVVDDEPDAVAQKNSSHQPPTSNPTAVSSSTVPIGAGQRTGHWKILAPAVVGLVAALVAGALYLRSRHAAPLTEKDTIILADFTNSTGDPVFDGALKQALAMELQHSPFLSIFSQENTRQTLAYMRRSQDEQVTGAVAREICKRNGIKALIVGEISQIGTQYVLNVIASDCLIGDTLAQEQTQAMTKEQVLPA